MHAEAEQGPRGVVIYLLPGLTPAQRKAALRRLRQEGDRGCGPRLPPGRLAVALTADRMRAGVRHIAAAVRHHPFGTLVSALLAGGLLAVFVFAFVSVVIAVPRRSEPPAGSTARWTAPAREPVQGEAVAPALPRAQGQRAQGQRAQGEQAQGEQAQGQQAQSEQAQGQPDPEQADPQRERTRGTRPRSGRMRGARTETGRTQG